MFVVVEKNRPLGPRRNRIGAPEPPRHLNPKRSSRRHIASSQPPTIFLRLPSLLLYSSKSANTTTRHAKIMRTPNAQSQFARHPTLSRLALDA